MTASPRCDPMPPDHPPAACPLARLRPRLARAAQGGYDDWDDGDGFGGCLLVARGLARVLAAAGWYADVVDLDCDPPHTVVWASDGTVAVTVDVPWERYERADPVAGGHWWWRKTPGVQFTPADVRVVPFADPADAAAFADKLIAEEPVLLFAPFIGNKATLSAVSACEPMLTVPAELNRNSH